MVVMVLVMVCGGGKSSGYDKNGDDDLDNDRE